MELVLSDLTRTLIANLLLEEKRKKEVVKATK